MGSNSKYGYLFPRKRTRTSSQVGGTSSFDGEFIHGNLGGGSLHALATENLAGFMSANEKVYMNVLTSPIAERYYRTDSNGNLLTRSPSDFRNDLSVLEEGTNNNQIRNNEDLDNRYARTEINETFDKNLTVTGDLIVNGSEFISNTETVEIEDNLGLINSGEEGEGITAGFAGWQVDRGTADDFLFGFQESNSAFSVGKDGTTLQAIATREDNPTISGVPFWNNSENRFDTSTDITWSGTHLLLGNQATTTDHPVRADRSLKFTSDDALSFDEEGFVDLTLHRSWKLSIADHGEDQRGVINAGLQDIYGVKTFQDNIVFTDQIVSSGTFVSGFAGAGALFAKDYLGMGAYAEVDNLTVRERFRVYELLIQQIRATNGSLWVSSAVKVEEVTDLGNGVYRCFIGEDQFVPFLHQDDQISGSGNDLIRAQRFTGTGVYLVNGEVIDVENGEADVNDNSTARYFDMTITANSDIPQGGMDFVRIGNTNDINRQGALYLTSDDVGAPFMDVLDDIDSHSAFNDADKNKLRLGKLEGITVDGIQLDGYGLFSRNVYLTGSILAGDITKEGNYVEYKDGVLTLDGILKVQGSDVASELYADTQAGNAEDNAKEHADGLDDTIRTTLNNIFENAIQNEDTIIVGGYIDTSLINTDAILVGDLQDGDDYATLTNVSNSSDDARDEARNDLAVELGYEEDTDLGLSAYEVMIDTVGSTKRTLIIGGYLNTSIIEAESIVASKLAFTPTDSSNVVGRINASDEGLQIDTDKLDISTNIFELTTNVFDLEIDSNNYMYADSNGMDIRASQFRLNASSILIDSSTPRVEVGNVFEVRGDNNTGQIAGWQFSDRYMRKLIDGTRPDGSDITGSHVHVTSRQWSSHRLIGAGVFFSEIEIPEGDIRCAHVGQLHITDTIDASDDYGFEVIQKVDSSTSKHLVKMGGGDYFITNANDDYRIDKEGFTIRTSDLLQRETAYKVINNDGDMTGAFWGSSNTIHLQAQGGSTLSLRANDGGDVRLSTIDGGNHQLVGLATSDPMVNGALWVDSNRYLRVSTGN